MRLPLLLHCPHGCGPTASRLFFNYVQPYFVTRCAIAPAQTPMVFTYNNRPSLYPAQEQAARANIRLKVLAENYHPWSFQAKISEAAKALQCVSDANDLVLFADGRDTIFTRPPMEADLRARLAQYDGASVLFCSTPCDWPPDGACQRFEKRCSQAPKPHLSAGAYFGTAAAIRAGLAWICERISTGEFLHRGRFDDQLAFRRAHKVLYPLWQIDIHERVFARFDRQFIKGAPGAVIEKIVTGT